MVEIWTEKQIGRKIYPTNNLGTINNYKKKVFGLPQLLILLTIIAATFIQKIGLTIGTFQFYFSLPLLYFILALGFTSGSMEIHLRRSLAFVTCFGILMIEQVVNGRDVSLPSLALLIVVHAPYLFGFRPELLTAKQSLQMFQTTMLILAICGVVQFVAQFVIGYRHAFFLDVYFPTIILRMANISTVKYGSSIIRGNGVFFLEPSVFSQFTAISIIIELLYFNRISRLAILGTGLIASYSGTGIVLLALVLPFVFIKQKRIFLLVAMFSAAVLALIFAELLGLGLLVNRVHEFGQTGSSGYARFLSPFPVLRQQVFNNVQNMLFGIGAGNYKLILRSSATAAFDPSWAKILVEYGLFGFIVYMGFMGFCIFSAPGSFFLKLAVFIQFFILGGNNHIPPEHAMILAVLVWAGSMHPVSNWAKPTPRSFADERLRERSSAERLV